MHDSKRYHSASATQISLHVLMQLLYNRYDFIYLFIGGLTIEEISGITAATAFLVLGIIMIVFLIAVKGIKTVFSATVSFKVCYGQSHVTKI